MKMLEDDPVRKLVLEFSNWRKGEKDPVRKLDLEKVTRDFSSPEDPRSQQSKLIVPGEIAKQGMVKKRRNSTKPSE